MGHRRQRWIRAAAAAVCVLLTLPVWAADLQEIDDSRLGVEGLFDVQPLAISAATEIGAIPIAADRTWGRPMIGRLLESAASRIDLSAALREDTGAVSQTIHAADGSTYQLIYTALELDGGMDAGRFGDGPVPVQDYLSSYFGLGTGYYDIAPAANTCAGR